VVGLDVVINGVGLAVDVGRVVGLRVHFGQFANTDGRLASHLQIQVFFAAIDFKVKHCVDMVVSTYILR
jgi:hypothetical protein